MSGIWVRTPRSMDVHECQLPMRDHLVRVPVPDGRRPMTAKVGIVPNGQLGDAWVCACGRVYRIEWLRGRTIPDGHPVYGKPGTRLYANVFESGPSWRERHGIVARAIRRRASA